MTGPGFFFTFLYYFAITILITLVVTTGGLGWSYNSPITYQTATLFGLIAGSIGAINNRSQSITVDFAKKKLFIRNLEQKLSDLGFVAQEAQAPDTLVYQKSGVSTWFSGPIVVKLGQKQATISSRRRNINQLNRLI